ncbi:MAG: hypothetical protein ACREI2_03555 [Nitrospiraceae bacterium]
MQAVQIYVPIKQLASISAGSRPAVTVLRAYMDESGHSADPHALDVTIGGAVASIEQWEAFEPSWRAVLDEFSVSQLHMKDFAHFQGEYEGWTEPRRREFLQRLFDVINAHVEGYVGGTMPVDLFSGLTPDQQALLGNDPYYPCFIACVIAAATCAAHASTEEQVHLFFAELSGFQGKALQYYERCKSEQAPPGLPEKLAGITFASPKSVLPLQVGDLVAYEVNLHFRHAKQLGTWTERWPFSQIKGKMLAGEYFDLSALKLHFGLEFVSSSGDNL